MNVQQESSAERPGLGPVLIVEDEATIRETIQWTLEDEGFQVRTAADGQEALDVAAQTRPSMVILDMRLPRLNGDQVADGLRLTHGDVPIVVITADGHAAQKAQRVGAVGYLHKPFDIADLIGIVRKTLQMQ